MSNTNQITMSVATLRIAVRNLLHDIHLSAIEAGKQLDAYQSFIAEHKAADREGWDELADIELHYGEFAEAFEKARALFFKEPAAPSVNDLSVELSKNRTKLRPRRLFAEPKPPAAAGFLRRALAELSVATAGLQAYVGLVSLLIVLGDMDSAERDPARKTYYGAGCVEYLVREMLKKHYPEAAEVQP